MRYKHNPHVVVDGRAIGAKFGLARFYSSSPGSCYNSLNSDWCEPGVSVNQRSIAEVSVTTLDELIRLYSRPDYLKIDIEGFEWPAIQGLSQKIPIISFEANLPQFRKETLLVLNRLIELGPETLFNLREGNRLVFSNHVSVESVRNAIHHNVGSYDVFAFSR
jgi:FkbM family methyltransferase